MRFAVVDIETTDLKGDKGFMLCCGIKPLGGKKRVIGLHEHIRPTRRLNIDAGLVMAVRDALESFDGYITWNGIMFDIPFINDRLMLNGSRPLERRFHIDAMYYARQGKSTFTSSRLDWVSKSLDVKSRKTGLDMNTWKMAEAEAIVGFKAGHKNYDQIITHNLADLDVTEQVYEKLKPRISAIQKR